MISDVMYKKATCKLGVRFSTRRDEAAILRDQLSKFLVELFSPTAFLPVSRPSGLQLQQKPTALLETMLVLGIPGRTLPHSPKTLLGAHPVFLIIFPPHIFIPQSITPEEVQCSMGEHASTHNPITHVSTWHPRGHTGIQNPRKPLLYKRPYQYLESHSPHYFSKSQNPNAVQAPKIQEIMQVIKTPVGDTLLGLQTCQSPEAQVSQARRP